MKRCPRCKWPIPFLGCPTCPPKAMTCPKCGFHPIWVDPMDVGDYEESITFIPVDDTVDLGAIKTKRKSIL